MTELKESPLVPSPVVGAFCGWLSPDGTFYACEPWEHEAYAWRLTEKLGLSSFYAAGRELESAKWVKLKSGSWIVVCREEVAQRQLDSLFELGVLERPDARRRVPWTKNVFRS